MLIDGWFQQFDSHSIGAIAFGPDGALYASGGDAASWQFVDYGQQGEPPNPGGDPPVPVGGTQTPPTAEGGALRAQDLRTDGDPVGLNGTVIRINPDTGAAMPDNPNIGHPDPNAKRIVAYGLRNPFRIAAKANANEPAVVSADGDTVDLWADLFGRAVVLSGHPNPEAPVSINATASGDTAVLAAPGASLSLHICKGTILNAGASPIVVALQENGSATSRWSGELAAEGGGAAFDFGSRGWKLTANTGLDVNLNGAGDVRVNVTEYYIAP